MRYTSYRARFKLPPANGADLSRNQAITAVKAQMEERAGSSEINDYIVEALLFYEQAKAGAVRGMVQAQEITTSVAANSMEQPSSGAAPARAKSGPELAQLRAIEGVGQIESPNVDNVPNDSAPDALTFTAVTDGTAEDIQSAVVEAISGDMPAIVPMNVFKEDAEVNEEKDDFVPMEMDRVNPKLSAQPKSPFAGGGFMV